MANISIPYEPVFLDLESFDKMLSDQGVTFLHYKAIPCPIGLTDAMDSRESHAEHSECSNGFIYEYAGEVSGVYKNNSSAVTIAGPGFLDGSTAAVSLNRYYNDKPNEEVLAMVYDRLFLKEFAATVPMTQKLEASITGRDRLQYSIESIETVYDSNNTKYSPSDYTIQNGQLVWTGTNRPQFNTELNKGAIISVRYRYRPYYYVSRLIHEIRLARKADFMTGQIITERAPYEILISREYYFHKQQRDGTPMEPDSDRLGVAPRTNIFSPR